MRLIYKLKDNKTFKNLTTKVVTFVDLKEKLNKRYVRTFQRLVLLFYYLNRHFYWFIKIYYK